jgi:hypothetical protein
MNRNTKATIDYISVGIMGSAMVANPQKLRC